MSEQQIRTQLLYCQDDPVKKLILEKYLKLVIQKKTNPIKTINPCKQVEPILTLPVIDNSNIDDELLKDIFDSEEISIGSSLDELDNVDDTVEEDKTKNTTLNRDHLNNNLMERMNSDIDIRNQSKKPIHFDPPFGEGGTDIYPSFEDIGKNSIENFSGKKKY
jgi:hypothetical protein